LPRNIVLEAHAAQKADEARIVSQRFEAAIHLQHRQPRVVFAVCVLQGRNCFIVPAQLHERSCHRHAVVTGRPWSRLKLEHRAIAAARVSRPELLGLARIAGRHGCILSRARRLREAPK
jgi:hypothetical protein